MIHGRSVSASVRESAYAASVDHAAGRRGDTLTLHKRTAYVDDPARPRHLLRLWLAARDFADGDDLLRGGFTTP